MSDFLEEAAETSELLLKESLSKRQAVPEKTGHCLFCEEETAGSFCSAECREDWELIDKINRMKGKPNA